MQKFSQAFLLGGDIVYEVVFTYLPRGQDVHAESCLNAHHHRDMPAHWQSLCRRIAVPTSLLLSAEHLRCSWPAPKLGVQSLLACLL